ncbi:MAG: hypothetical protein AAFO04_25350 [Cyanobacteria bacterium J06592_8]
MKEKTPSPCHQCPFKRSSEAGGMFAVVSSVEEGFLAKCLKNPKFYCVSYCRLLNAFAHRLLDELTSEE